MLLRRAAERPITTPARGALPALPCVLCGGRCEVNRGAAGIDACPACTRRAEAEYQAQKKYADYAHYSVTPSSSAAIPASIDARTG